jgi:hypothetical protein
MDFEPDYDQPDTRPDRSLYWLKVAALSDNGCAICSKLFRTIDDQETNVSSSIRDMFNKLFLCVDVRVGELKDIDNLEQVYRQQLIKLQEMREKLRDFQEYFDDVEEGLALAKEVVSCVKSQRFSISEKVNEFSNKIKEKLPKDIQL